MEILLIEDDPAYSRLVQHWLRELFPDSLTFLATGQIDDAVEALQDRQFDLVILDLVFPGYDRIMAIYPIVAAVQPYGTPILVLSGLPDSVSQDAIHAGAKMYLSKNHLTSAEQLGQVVSQLVPSGHTDAWPVA